MWIAIIVIIIALIWSGALKSFCGHHWSLTNMRCGVEQSSINLGKSPNYDRSVPSVEFSEFSLPAFRWLFPIVCSSLNDAAQKYFWHAECSHFHLNSSKGIIKRISTTFGKLDSYNKTQSLKSLQPAIFLSVRLQQQLQFAFNLDLRTVTPLGPGWPASPVVVHQISPSL